MITTRERLAATSLWAGLAAAGLGTGSYELDGAPAEVPAIEAWVRARIEALGVEGGDDLALLSPPDFEAPDVPAPVRAYLDKQYPRTVDTGDAKYEAEYAMNARQVTLRMVRGSRQEPPPAGTSRAFGGCASSSRPARRCGSCASEGSPRISR